MAFARVVSFDGVTKQRIEELRREIGEQGRPDEIPATEIMILHDPEGEKSLAILFFDTEDDYRKGDAALDAMPDRRHSGEPHVGHQVRRRDPDDGLSAGLCGPAYRRPHAARRHRSDVVVGEEGWCPEW